MGIVFMLHQSCVEGKWAQKREPLLKKKRKVESPSDGVLWGDISVGV